MKRVEPWELLACVVGQLYVERREAALGLCIVHLWGKPSSWSDWASRVGPEAVAALEARLSLHSLDDFLNVVDSLSVLPPSCSPNALIPLVLRSVALSCRALDFAGLVAAYEALVAWLRGLEPPRSVHPDARLRRAVDARDHDAARSLLAQRAEREGRPPVEVALAWARVQRACGPQDEARLLARQAAALAAELGQPALVEEALALAAAAPAPVVGPVRVEGAAAADARALALFTEALSGDNDRRNAVAVELLSGP